jgi:hypothetical protein
MSFSLIDLFAFNFGRTLVYRSGAVEIDNPAEDILSQQACW